MTFHNELWHFIPYHAALCKYVVWTYILIGWSCDIDIKKRGGKCGICLGRNKMWTTQGLHFIGYKMEQWHIIGWECDIPCSVGVCFGLDVATASIDPTFLVDGTFHWLEIVIVPFHWVQKVGTNHTVTLKMDGRDISVLNVTVTFANSPCRTHHHAEPSVAPVGNPSPLVGE